MKNDLTESTTARLRREIILGTLSDQHKLREIPIAERLGIARGTLRLALGTLEGEGLVQRHANGRRYVSLFNEKSILDIYMMRTILETQAVSILNKRGMLLCSSVAAALDQIAISCTEHLELVKLDIAFHRSIIAATQSAYMMRCWDLLSPTMEILLTLNADTSYSYEYIYDFYEKHRHIYNRIMMQDDQVGDYLSKHIAVACELSVKLLNNHRRQALLPVSDADNQEGKNT